jgi:inner membrane protein
MVRSAGIIRETGAHPQRLGMTGWLGLSLIISALVIVAADASFHAFRPSLVIAGALDEPAHAATTVIILGALGWPGTRGFVVAAMVASMAIDLDHIPQYLGSHFLTAGTPRPYPHSFVTLLAVGGAAVLSRDRARCLAIGAELGLIGHIFRDMAEPSSKAGVALFWPVSDVNVRVPYVVYAVLMAVLLVVGLRRLAVKRRSADPAAQRAVGSGAPAARHVE